jgi:tetratricopeptide (TPR) repeat protein
LRKAGVLRAAVWLVVAIGVAQPGWAQAAGAPVQEKPSAAAPAKKSCAVDTDPPNAAETALNKRRYALAETSFRAMLAKDPGDDDAREGLVRTLIGQDKVDEAMHESEAWNAKEPGNTVALTALAEATLRNGEPNQAFLLFQKAAQADLCNARAYYGMSEIDGLAGLYASRKKAIDQAHVLHPTDDEIAGAWTSTLPRKEQMARWTEYAEHSDQIGDEDRTKLKAWIEKQTQVHPSDCRAAPGSPTETKMPMVAVTDGPQRFIGWGLDIQFNGKRRRLQIDTGASGITISRAAAQFLGIKREEATSMFGIGDKGQVKTSVTHVASIKIGGMEFTNCAVDILEKWSVLDSDGLIGADVFRNSAVTLDFPKHELRIAPLPERPGEKKVAGSLDTAGDEEVVEPHNPYIAPEMAKWERIYRSGHDLLVPAGIVETKRAKDETAWRNKLFLLDTGSQTNLISPRAAREVAKVSRDDSVSISGISGEVNKVFEAGKFTLGFAGLRLDTPSMTAIDTTSISHGAGVEVSGLIGAPALFQVVFHIDYRDNLVWCEYTPK